MMRKCRRVGSLLKLERDVACAKKKIEQNIPDQSLRILSGSAGNLLTVYALVLV